MSNKELFKEAHKMAKEIKKEYPEVNYMFQFSLCLSYLKESKEEVATWETVSKAAEKAVEKMGYTNYYVNNWTKGDNDRSYIELRWYRNGKCKSTLKCGYWDNKNNEYIVDSKFQKNYNVFEI